MSHLPVWVIALVCSLAGGLAGGTAAIAVLPIGAHRPTRSGTAPRPAMPDPAPPGAEPVVDELAEFPEADTGWWARLQEDVREHHGPRAAAGPDAAASAKPPPPLEWCARRWHTGTCCPASAEQYKAHGAAPQITPPAPPEPAPALPALPVPELPAPIARGVQEAHQARIRRLDLLSHRDLLDLAISVSEWDAELVDRGLSMLRRA